MKRFLLFVLIAAAASSACKKTKKDVITPETLQGTWQEQLPLSSSALPISVIFRGDSTYTQHYGGFVGTLHGTYSTNSTGTNMLQTVLTRNGGPKDTFLIKIASSNRLVVTYKNNAVRDFLRQ